MRTPLAPTAMPRCLSPRARAADGPLPVPVHAMFSARRTGRGREMCCSPLQWSRLMLWCSALTCLALLHSCVLLMR